MSTGSLRARLMVLGLGLPWPAPEGRQNLAQGASPGTRRIDPEPWKGEREPSSDRVLFRPSGAPLLSYQNPRLTPWATSFRPLRGLLEEFRAR